MEGRFGNATNVPVTALAPSNQAAFVSQTVPTTMYARDSNYVSITMKNVGTTIWQAGTTYKLGSQNPQDNTIWGTRRMALPYSVPPGSQVTFEFFVTAPPNSGSYNFQWQMVQEGVEWFGDYTPNVVIRVKPACSTC